MGKEIGVAPEVILETSHGRRSIDILKILAPEKANWECKSAHPRGLFPLSHRNGCPWRAIGEANQVAVRSSSGFEGPQSGWEGPELPGFQPLASCIFRHSHGRNLHIRGLQTPGGEELGIR